MEWQPSAHGQLEIRAFPLGANPKLWLQLQTHINISGEQGCGKRSPSQGYEQGQWYGKELPACEGGLHLQLTFWLPGLEELSCFTGLLVAFLVGSKMTLVPIFFSFFQDKILHYECDMIYISIDCSM